MPGSSGGQDWYLGTWSQTWCLFAGVGLEPGFTGVGLVIESVVIGLRTGSACTGLNLGSSWAK